MKLLRTLAIILWVVSGVVYIVSSIAFGSTDNVYNNWIYILILTGFLLTAIERYLLKRSGLKEFVTVCIVLSLFGLIIVWLNLFYF